MSDKEPELAHRERSRSSPIMVVGLLFVLPLLYILSPPFAYLLAGEPLMDNPVCRVIYIPVIYLYEESSLIREFYDWYFALFPWAP